VVDIEARLANGRNTEKRLGEVLRNRTGKVSDVLEVEREIARVREEIERLLHAGPPLLLWLAILWWPVRRLVRVNRRSAT
jgi:uncharacterized protein DUF4349